MQSSTSVLGPSVKQECHATSLNPLDHSFRAHRKPCDAEPGDPLSSDEEPVFECVKRRLDTPGNSDDETDKDDGDAGVDHGKRLYGKSADIHLVGPTMFWKHLHIKEVTPPDPQPVTHPPDPGTFPRVRRPIYWGPPFPVSILLYVNVELPNSHRFQVGTRMGRRPYDESLFFSFLPRHLPASRSRRRTDRPLLHPRQRGISFTSSTHLLRPLE